MTRIDPERLKRLRDAAGLSQEALAKKARLTKQTVYRLEKGPQRNIRQRNLTQISEALGVHPEVLTGQRPLDIAAPSKKTSAEDGFQLSIRVDAPIRNALTLAALRYKVPITRIVELAPFLFVLAAEQSLDRRRAKLAELTALFDREDELRSDFAHLPLSITPSFEATDAIGAEAKSIDARDILGSRLPDNLFWRFPPTGPAGAEDYEEARHNPFVTYLRQMAAKNQRAAEIESFSLTESPSYRICEDDAMTLADGAPDLAGEILAGAVVIHDIPRHLLAADATAERIKWLRVRSDEWRRQLEMFTKNFNLDDLNVEDLSLPPTEDSQREADL